MEDYKGLSKGLKKPEKDKEKYLKEIKKTMPFVDPHKEISFSRQMPKYVNVPKVLKRAIGR